MSGQIVDIDELVAQEELFKFKVKGKEYTVPDRTYEQAIKIAQKGKIIEAAIKGMDAEAILKGNAELLAATVVELEYDYIIKNLTQREVQAIFKAVNENQFKATKTEEDEELAYYRRKNKDRYRKNVQKQEEE